MDSTAESYANEPVRYPALHVIDLAGEGYHPTSDELFIVVSGCLVIDLEDHRELRLQPWQCVTIPAMTVHRTRAVGRTVNLCFERLGAETVFVDGLTL